MADTSSPGLPALVADVVRRSDRALLSSEIATRLRRPRPEVEEALAALHGDPTVIVRDWPMEDPHLGVPRIVVAARVHPGAGDAAAEAQCQQVYEDLLRDFLVSHRCT